MVFGAEDQIQVGPELLGSLPFKDLGEWTNNLEIFIGGKYRLPHDLVVGVGGGMGLTTGVDTPDARGVFSVAWTPRADKDSDGDGILNVDDACASVAGVANEDPAKHGCPADTDGDGIIDNDDACPKVAGVKNADPKINGCPPAAPADADGDGILDADDACPQAAGKADPDPKKNGCPDTDGDGFLDKDDACPKVAGIASSDPAKHGCPVTDKDGDGILDAVDACPAVAGLKTEDPKTNGCPDKDGDSFIDSIDGCPDQPGPDNTDPAKRGCPIVAILDQDLKGVEFDTNLASIRPASKKVLDNIAKLLKEHPELKKLEIQGHTDNRGTPMSNKILSDARAKAVRRALISRGIKADRLTAKGYGQDKPIAGNDTPDGQQRNRRVQFKILEQNP